MQPAPIRARRQLHNRHSVRSTASRRARLKRNEEADSPGRCQHARISSARSQDLLKILRLRRIPAKSSALHVTYLYDIMDGVSIVIFITQKMLMTKRTALKTRMLFRKISSVNRCRQNVLKGTSRTNPQPRKSPKRQIVRRSKIATRAQHSRAALVAQVHIAELG